MLRILIKAEAITTDGTLTTDKFLEYKRTGNRNFKVGDEDTYNCHACSFDALAGNEIDKSTGVLDPFYVEKQIHNVLYDTKPDEAIFGNTMIAFTNGAIITHTAIFYGISNDGEIYVYTKNGSDVRPEIMPLNDLLIKTNSVLLKAYERYGKIHGYYKY